MAKKTPEQKRFEKLMRSMTKFANESPGTYKDFLAFEQKISSWTSQQHASFSNTIRKLLHMKLLEKYNAALRLKQDLNKQQAANAMQWRNPNFLRHVQELKQRYHLELRDIFALKTQFMQQIVVEKTQFDEIDAVLREVIGLEKQLNKFFKGSEFKEGFQSLKDLRPIIRNIIINLQAISKWLDLLVKHEEGMEVDIGRTEMINQFEQHCEAIANEYTALDTTSDHTRQLLYGMGNDYTKGLAVAQRQITERKGVFATACVAGLAMIITAMNLAGIPNFISKSDAETSQAPLVVRSIIQQANSPVDIVEAPKKALDTSNRIKILEDKSRRLFADAQMAGKSFNVPVENIISLSDQTLDVFTQGADAYYEATAELSKLYRNGRRIPNTAPSAHLTNNRIKWAKQITALLAATGRNGRKLGTEIDTLPRLRTTVAMIKGLPGTLIR